MLSPLTILDESRNLFRVTNYGHRYRPSLGQAPEVLDQSRQSTPHVGLNDFLAALRADARRDGFDHDQLSLKPKVLIDSALFHLLTADVTFSVIIS
jgi:hypothetical protein